MDLQVVVVLSAVLIALAVIGLAWFVVARMSSAAPAKLAAVIIALAAFVGAVATIVEAIKS